MLHNRKIIGLALPIFMIFIVVIVSGCAQPKKTVEEVVMEKAQQRWDALLSGDIDKAYSYFSKGYKQAVTIDSYKMFLRTKQVAWTGAKVESANCEQNKCKVSMRVSFKVPMQYVGEIESNAVIQEGWLLVDNRWSHVPKK